VPGPLLAYGAHPLLPSHTPTKDGRGPHRRPSPEALHAADQGEGREVNRTPAREWAHVLDSTSEQDRRAALADFLGHCNPQRPHFALEGRPPLSRTSGSDYRIVLDQPPEPLGPTPGSSRSRTLWDRRPETPQPGSVFKRILPGTGTARD
jgi:hypothetical protein